MKKHNRDRDRTITYMAMDVKEKNAVGICRNAKHFGYLTEKMLNMHDCLGKHCLYLEKIETHKFWADRG